MSENPYNAEGARKREWITPAMGAEILGCSPYHFSDIQNLVSSTTRPGKRRKFYRRSEVELVADIVSGAGVRIQSAARVMAAQRDGRLPW